MAIISVAGTAAMAIDITDRITGRIIGRFIIIRLLATSLFITARPPCSSLDLDFADLRRLPSQLVGRKPVNVRGASAERLRCPPCSVAKMQFRCVSYTRG
jgi:hypothetical protein